ncbi:outer membrane beta-barrel protein [Deminuibacter soli]|uniref:Outer membrane protein beta-barrel domain-containing protein n=1 Tax=Deminuibacter soli TaxID=2291815 RepID=A0A3E1NE24_9BACT|nr:outer membrane beta-barrel protein [Deminuibacter soli]RFM26215.1 hypothetical protein DXN05_21710 [Deminuibacter soli]
MKRMNIVLTACILLLAAVSAKAQEGGLKVDLYYNYSNPVGSFKNNYISNSSPRGVAGDVMYNINRQWSAGLYFGYQDYYQKYPRSTYHTAPGEDISAVVSNSVQTAPFMAKGVFTPLGNKLSIVQPYISAAAGVNFITDKQYLGQFGTSNTAGRFIAQGGAGVQINFGRLSDAGITLGAVYNYAPYNRFGVGSLNSIDFQAGVHFPLR